MLRFIIFSLRIKQEVYGTQCSESEIESRDKELKRKWERKEHLKLENRFRFHLHIIQKGEQTLLFLWNFFSSFVLFLRKFQFFYFGNGPKLLNKRNRIRHYRPSNSERCIWFWTTITKSDVDINKRTSQKPCLSHWTFAHMKDERKKISKYDITLMIIRVKAMWAKLKMLYTKSKTCTLFYALHSRILKWKRFKINAGKSIVEFLFQMQITFHTHVDAWTLTERVVFVSVWNILLCSLYIIFSCCIRTYNVHAVYVVYVYVI